VRAKLRDKVPSVDVEPGFHAGGANDAGGLVQKAYDQLKARKETIEAELARIEALRAEHESVAAQVAALDEAMDAFKPQGERQRKAG
jgi:predicted transcriptional regulator